VTTAKARSRFAAVCAVSCAARYACAQPSPVIADAGAPALEEIVVTADRRGSYSADLVQVGSFRGARQLDTPLTVNVIPEALIQSQQSQSLLDALRNIAGVSPSQTSITVYSNVAIRGINVENRSNYRLNGVLPIVNLVDLPLEDKERIEALKGASALYYGFTTPAGIVNLTMKRPTPEPYVAATLFGNEDESFGAHVDVGNTWGAFGARVNAVYGSVDSGIEDTRGRRSLLAAALDFKPSDRVTLSLDAEHIEKRVNEPGVFRYARVPAPTLANLYPGVELPPLLDPSVNFGPDWASNRAAERNVLLGMTWRISSAWELSTSYGNSHLVRDRHFNTIDLDTYGAGTNGTGVLSIGLQPGATFENANRRAEVAGAANLGFTKHQLLLGASQNIRDGFSSTTVAVTCPGAAPAAARVPCVQNVFDPVVIPETPLPPPRGPRTRVDDVGFYLFDRIEMASWLQVLVGLRKADYAETSLDTGAVAFEDDPTSVSYGVVVKPRPWLSVYGTYIEGLESTPPAPNSAANAGEMLPAADSTQREAGVKLEPRRGLLIQAAHFDIERVSAFVNGANVYVLDGRARFRGTEVSVTGEVTPNWSLYATAQSLEAKQVSGAATLAVTNPATGAVTVVPTVVGRKIENTPERTLSLAAEYRFTGSGFTNSEPTTPGVSKPGFSVNGAAYYVSERAVNAFNQAFIPSYTLFDVGAAYTRTFRGNETTIRVTAQNVADKKYFSSTGASIIAQGPPRTLRFSLSAKF
jgi:iron complex outermembrane recepter protein